MRGGKIIFLKIIYQMTYIRTRTKTYLCNITLIRCPDKQEEERLLR